MRSSLRQTLRDSTDTAHRALEASVDRQGLLRSQEGYAAFLLGWYRLQCAVEQALDAAEAGRVIPDWLDRRRAGLIARDLDALRLSLPDLPDGPPLRITSEGAILGAAYVVEGATLGAQTVRPAIEKLGTPASGAVQFLTGPAIGAGRQWRAFVELLDRWSDRVDHSEAADAARQTFALASSLLVLPSEVR